MMEFLEWCKRSAGIVDGLDYIFQEKEPGDERLYRRSHIVAYNTGGAALRCSWMVWPDPIPMWRVLRFIEELRITVRS